MKINGIDFKDYALASANSANGMSDELIAKVFGMEVPVWQETRDQWNAKMAELSPDDMKFFGEVFMNPKQGKFAQVEGAASGPEEVLKKYPEWSDHVKIQQHYAISEEVGIQLDIQKEYGISMTEYAQLGMYWAGKMQKAVEERNTNPKRMDELLEEHAALMKKWEDHFRALYKDQNTGIGDDIDF